MTREEHLKWCKERALEYARQDDASAALTSMVSDLSKHEETRSSVEIISGLGTRLLMAGMMGTPAQIAEFIEGVN
jgi:hypothetical protein